MKPTNKKFSYIYKLLDPRDMSVKYIGATVNPRRRQSQHKSGQFVGRDVSDWSNELKKLKTYPYLVVIEKCPIDQSSVREKYWIDYYVDNGALLLNWDGVKRKYGHDKPGNSIRTK